MPGIFSPWVLLLGIVFVALAAVPTRRLGQAGVTAGALLAYLGLLVGLAFVVALGRGPDRLLVPVLVGLYVAPFIAGPELLRRILRRARRPTGSDEPTSHDG
jgi:hypothetical protein